MKWINFVIGLVGVVGVLLQNTTDVGSWLVAGAFFLIFLSGFQK